MSLNKTWGSDVAKVTSSLPVQNEFGSASFVSFFFGGGGLLGSCISRKTEGVW